MYTIGDLVKLDEHITEQSVVQIDFYTERERNLALLENFVFARFAPEGKVSNLDVLYRLRETSLTDARENIFCIIANYGQGKSHLGLVLANYFGRDVRSEEFQKVMDKIAHAEGDEVRVRNLREFREQRKPYLVLRLRGDSPRPLDQQFLQAMQSALNEAGIEGKLPLWYEKAAEWLENLPQRGMKERADEFLSQHDTDLPSLIARVREFDQQTHEVVNQLHRHLIGTYPHFEGDLEPKDLLRWLVRQYCGEQQRFGGVLILFDEFSQFIERYYLQRQYAGSLQRLLETVDSLRQRVLLVAFAQHDPAQMARDAMGGASGPQVEEALRELQRIPERNKLRLDTRMEQVLDGYLKQENTPFPTLLQQNTDLDDQLWDAGTLTRKTFSSRYSQQQEWTDEQFHEFVCKGCFPLHPFTTAILCQGIPTSTAHLDNPRTVLGFVLERVGSKLAEPAITKDGKPNWIYAIDLVDYFSDMLPEQELFQYRTALQRIEGSPSPQEMAVLKAILLLTLANIPTRREEFVQVVSHLSGLDTASVKQTLHQLAEILALYEEQGRYRFFSLGGDLRRLQQIKQEIWAKPPSEADVRRLNDLYHVSPEVPVTWGHQDDWAPEQVIWLTDQFTEQNLKREAPLFRVTDKGLNLETRHGLVIRLLARSDEELSGLRERVSEILDKAFPGEDAPAILVVLPAHAMPDLLRWVRWDNYLWAMPAADRQQIGEELLKQEIASAQREIGHTKERLLSNQVSSSSGAGPRLVVPKAYRVAFQQTNPQTVKDALRCLYEQAYRFAPPFFEQYNHASRKLRTDVKQICHKLAENRLGEIVKTFGNSPGTDCVHEYLQKRWRILDSDYRVHPPLPVSKVERAWELLDKTFSSQEVATPVGEVLLQLMNPPYGYHFHQLALLFSAWYGYNRERIELSIDGRLDNLLSVWSLPRVEQSERFIEQLVFVHRVAIKRRNVDEELERIQQLVRRVLSRTEYFTLQEAETALSMFKEALDRSEVDAELRENIQRSVQMLEKDMGIARDYDKRAEHLLGMAQSETSLQRLTEAYARPNLPELGIVLPVRPSQEKIQEQLMERIRQRVEVTCSEAERLNRIEDVSMYEKGLRTILPYVRLTRNQQLESRVQQAIQRVKQRAEELRCEAEDAGLIGEIQAMDAQAPLATLRRHRQRLQQMQPLSSKAREIHQSKRQEIEQAIQRFEQRLRDWRETSETAREREAMANLLEEILRHGAFYRDSPEEQQVQQVEKVCRSVLTWLEQIAGLTSSSPPNPARVSESREQLEQLRSQSEHPAVQEAVARAERWLEEYTRSEEEKALHWLQEREAEARRTQGADLRALFEQLQHPPAFLPTSERLEAVKAEVQRRIEEDAVQSVCVRLREIRDPDKLRQIREEIERLLKELGSA